MNSEEYFLFKIIKIKKLKKKNPAEFSYFIATFLYSNIKMLFARPLKMNPVTQFSDDKIRNQITKMFVISGC